MDKKTKAPYRPVIHTQADLERAWRHLMEPLGFATHSLWMMVIDDDERPIPHLTELTDLEPAPSAQSARELAEFVRMIAGSLPDVRVAFLLSRPRSGPADDADQAWAAVLYDAARGAGVACEVIHLATAESLVPIPWEALARRPTWRSA